MTLFETGHTNGAISLAALLADELAGGAPIVYHARNVVPDARLELPLVDQPRRGTLEDERGVDRSRPAGVLVDVEQHRARRSLARRRSNHHFVGPPTTTS